MGVKTRTKAERVLRRAVKPVSKALTKVQRPRGRSRGRQGQCGDLWQPGDDDGGAGVREPRRPLPSRPSDSIALELPR